MKSSEARNCNPQCHSMTSHHPMNGFLSMSPKSCKYFICNPFVSFICFVQNMNQ